MKRLLAIVAVAAGLAPVSAQQPAPGSTAAPAFEVASVKRNVGQEGSMTLLRLPPTPTGAVSVSNVPLWMLIQWAYELEESTAGWKLIPPPDKQAFLWEARFDIQAKPPDGAAPGQQYAMLRALLADRFKLRVHRETRPTPVYALTVVRPGRLGPALRPSTVDCAASHNDFTRLREFADARGTDRRRICGVDQYGSGPDEILVRSAGPMTELANSLTILDRPVVDETGLSGLFEWTLTFGSSQAAIDAGRTRIGTAIQEQLGLRLERKIVPYDVLVIDSVEMPSEN